MSKLKTLKELTNHSRDRWDCSSTDLKSEAVKWARGMEKGRKVFMEFFNLKEKDLENEKK